MDVDQLHTAAGWRGTFIQMVKIVPEGPQSTDGASAKPFRGRYLGFVAAVICQQLVDKLTHKRIADEF
jgi:hypothetical protein